MITNKGPLRKHQEFQNKQDKKMMITTEISLTSLKSNSSYNTVNLCPNRENIKREQISKDSKLNILIRRYQG